MSNPTDPTRPDPDQPDPKKPGAGDQPGTERVPTGRSSFEFELPPEVGSYSDLPPIPQPDAETSNPFNNPALPPRPTAARPATNSFDFIDLPPETGSGILSGTGLHHAPLAPTDLPQPNEPLLTPTSNEFTLPPPNLPPPAAPVADDDVFNFDAPIPTADPASRTLGSGILDLAEFEEVPEAKPASGVGSVPDVASLFPQPPSTPDLPTAASDSGVLQQAVPELRLPDVYPTSASIGSGELDLPVAEPASDVFGSASLPVAEPLSDEKMAPVVPAVTVTPTPDLEAVLADFAPGDVEPVAPASGWLDPKSGTETPVVQSTPAPDLEAALADFAPADAIEPVAPASDWINPKSDTAVPTIPASAEAEPDEVKPAEPVAPPAEPEYVPTGRSSFEFTLTQGDMDPVKLPDADEAGDFNSALPPRPEATRRPTNASFDFLDMPPEDGSGSGVKPGAGLQNIPLTPTAIDTGEPPLLTPTTNDINLPSIPSASAVPPAHDPDAAIGNLEGPDSVKPASGWLDSGILSAGPVVDLDSDPLAAPPTPGIESSDIFSGARMAEAMPVEHSDVIAATAYGGAPPAFEAGKPPEQARPSEVALTFEGPPGGSTMQDSGASDLPIADEVAGSSMLLGAEPVDTESIHDMPGMVVADPLFDSSKLAETPDPPPAPKRDDAPDYGRVPAFSPDASSILADLSDPDVGMHDADSSSVRVESPGVDRTLTSGEADGGFDLTVSDEPIPVDLFGEPTDATAAESTDWQSQSGSDLFAEGRTAPEIDLEEGRVEPVDADLAPDQPSLTSAPSSIFSGSKPTTGSGSAGSADVRVGDAVPPGDFADADLTEAAEFSDHPTMGGTKERSKGEPPAAPAKGSGLRKPHGLSSADFTLPPEATAPVKPLASPAEDDGGAIDWDDASLATDENATRGIPRDASLSAIIRGMTDGSAEAPTMEKSIPTEEASKPSVTVDWMAGSVEGPAIDAETTDPELEERARQRREKQEREAQQAKAKPGKKRPRDEDTSSAETRMKPARASIEESDEAPVARAEPSRKARRPEEKPAKKGGGMLVGALLGAIVAGGACAGVYFGGVVPNGEGTTKTGSPIVDNGKVTPPTAQPAADAKSAFAAGDTGKALELVKAKPAETTEDKATAGSVRVYAKVNGAGTDEDLKQGRADLKAVADDAEAAKTPEGKKRAVKATVDLGVSYEAAGDVNAAKKLFTDAKAKFPEYEQVFDALLDRLNSGPDGSGASFRLTPAEVEKVLLSVGVLLADDGPKVDDPEPGQFYWKAVKSAREGNYKEAIDLIGKAKAAHVKRAKSLAGRGLNPLTDPLEQMFPRSCDELATYWGLKAELYRNSDIADAVKKDELGKKLDSLLKAEKDLATAKADLKAATDKVAKLEKDAEKLDKDLKSATDDLKTAKVDLKTTKDDLKTANDNLKTATDSFKAAEKDAKDKGDLLAMIVTELKPAVTLPEKWGPADLVGGVKNIVTFAKDKDLKNVLDRLTKAETTAKTATEKLKTETERITTKYEADIKKLKDDYAADSKKLTDKYEGDIKKLTDDNAAGVKKLKDDYAADAKKAADKFAADTKKLNDDHDAAIKAEQAKTDAEKKNAALAAVNFQKQLANAVSPAQALEVWLPVLTDLRRPADADPAIAIARRALASAPADSDDEAKAHTTIGMGLLLKGNLPDARDEFQAAKRSRAYKADKPWARVADAGLEATTDPLSPYRAAVVIPPVDLRTAARSLDAGIAAYKAGRYEAAVTALSDAAKNDPADPVSWYYLGASRWALKNEEQAKKDILQGAEREKSSPFPARAISEALAPLQGGVRDLIDRARP